MVELEHATESLTAFDAAIRGSSSFARLTQLIAESLMVAFGVVMLCVFTHRVLQRLASEEDDPIQALGLQTARPVFHVRV